ncbi:hypothetical protein T484DRAFT_1877282 [Baffinella frigidus]|nr:hypothetical protein T484DRAFT_1877282 [Cryptophyta sp. CCMP2293]
MADPSEGKMMVYHTAPAPDRHWDPSVRKDGTKAVGGQWRGQSILPEHLPRGPKLNFGSRLGASATSKGVYFGQPGLPRSTYANLLVGPSLGPPGGLGKAQPKRVAEDVPSGMYLTDQLVSYVPGGGTYLTDQPVSFTLKGTYLTDQPVSFTLEGVVGFNPLIAGEIRGLRHQLGAVESVYTHSESDMKGILHETDVKSEMKDILHETNVKGDMKDILHETDVEVGRYEDELRAEDARRRELEEAMLKRKKELAALQEMMDTTTKELRREQRARKKESAALQEMMDTTTKELRRKQRASPEP